jgi:hypothetical protein
MVKRTELDDLRAAGAEILAELQRPDDISRRFNPLGLGGLLESEDAARFQTAVIASAVLADDVPEHVRNNFGRVRKLHLYGVLEYDFFTVADQQALLVLEGALRLRFLSYYDGGIPVETRGVTELLPATIFDDVREAKRRGATLRASDGHTYPLPLSTQALFAWARRERLLPGTQTRGVDQALSNLRNYAAHPVTHTVLMPPDSAETIRDVAEIINKLWGHDTPEGRFFPGPRERQPRVVGLSRDLNQAIELRLDQVATADEPQREWMYAVFLAVDHERLVDIPIGFAHQPGFQTTRFPCEMLWEGTWTDLMQAIDQGTFAACDDRVECLDRLFFIRKDAEATDLARSPDDLLALDEPPEGNWYAIVADTPFHAVAHVRDHESDNAPNPDACPDCHVRVQDRFKNAAEAVAAARSSGF